MTTSIGEPFGGISHPEPVPDRFGGSDRRGISGEPRRSWASAAPFVHRSTEHNGDLARATGWRGAVRRYRTGAVASDAILSLLVAFVCTATLPWGAHVAATLTAGALAAMTFALMRVYDERIIGDGSEEFQVVLRAGLLFSGLIVTMAYTIGLPLSPAPVVLGGPVLVVVILLGRYVLRRALARRRARGVAARRTIVIGEPHAALAIARDLREHGIGAFDVHGVCVPTMHETSVIAGPPVLGAFADVAQIVWDRAIDVVVVAGSSIEGDALRRMSWALDRAGAQLAVVPDLKEIAAPRLRLRPAAGMSLLEVETGASRGRLMAKNVLDRAVGLVFLVGLSPVIAGAAIAVRLTSPGPVLYRQTRVGVDGVPFTMLKLRSMFVDADRRKAELLAQNDGAGVLFKMRDDPRVTPVGKVLRRYSLDELPQLWNVVRGDMSLVGPRPPLLSEVSAYEDEVHRRLRVRPGLTGLWQVSGRSDLEWDEAVRLDLRYVDNWSVAMDMLILWRTGKAVLRGSGAY